MAPLLPKWRSESQAKNIEQARFEVSSLPPPHFPPPHLWGKIWHVGAAALQWLSAWANVCPVFGQSSSERNIDTSSNKQSLYLAIKKLKLKSPIMVKMRNKKKYWLRSSQQVITGIASRPRFPHRLIKNTMKMQKMELTLIYSSVFCCHYVWHKFIIFFIKINKSNQISKQSKII